jgi:glycosyltransferase involved in cell wall biosynthesis
MRIVIDLQGAQSGSRHRGIGRYSLALGKAIVRNRGSHEIFILLNGLFPESIREIKDSFSGILPNHHVIVFNAPGPVDEAPVENYWRVRTAELLRENFIRDLSPDLLLVSSLFEGVCDNTVTSIGQLFSQVPTAVILYDLIPYINPEKYLTGEVAKKWYYRKIEHLKRADLLLAISNSSRNEVINHLGIDPQRVVGILSAADTLFSKANLSGAELSELRTRYGIKRKFLMHMSAFDLHKNFDGLIKAFGILPKRLRNKYQLVLVCTIDDAQRESLNNIAAAVGLENDDLILTGYVPDDDLIALYSECYLFVFPSFHEGFGLPPLEAMCCGAAVIGSNTTSIPEVIGREDALFDPKSNESMATLIERALSDTVFWQSLKQHAITQSNKFSWDRCAQIAIETFEKLYTKGTVCRASNSDPDNLVDLIENIINIKSGVQPSEQDIIGTAISINKNENTVRWLRSFADFSGRGGGGDHGSGRPSHPDPAIRSQGPEAVPATRSGYLFPTQDRGSHSCRKDSVMRIVVDLQGGQSCSRNRGIGRYSLSLAEALVRNRGEHEVILALNGLFADMIEPIRAEFAGLLPQEHICVWQAPGPVRYPAPASNWRRKAAELMREAFLASLDPDIILVTSFFEGFMDDAVTSIGLLAQTIPTAVTLHDLIPLIHRNLYLGNPVVESWYENKIDQLRRADLLLAVSESSRQEAIRHLGFPPERVINTSEAAAPQFHCIDISNATERLVRKRYGLSQPFVMYTGAIDHRKNIEGLIRAFALLPKSLRKEHQLAIVCSVQPERRRLLEALAKKQGLAENQVILTGFVPDEDLVALYHLCKAFVFPSWHEGFGLPALEAMSCGAAVIGANTSSVPEVIGREDALFDPFDDRAIADKLTHVLKDSAYRAELIHHGLEQAKKFSWDASAKRAIAALEQFHALKILRKDKKKHYTLGEHTSEVILTRHAPRTCADQYARAIVRYYEQVQILRPKDYLVRAIAKIEGGPSDEGEWRALAKAIAQNYPASTEKQLLIDISELVDRDVESGIQRVVRSVLSEILANPPQGFRVEPVYAGQDGKGYRYARQYTLRFLGCPEEAVEDEPIEAFNGDIFLGLDLAPIEVVRQADFFSYLRRMGIRVYFLIHDLLPILMPDAFDEYVVQQFMKWLESVTESDGMVCVSQAVANELIECLTVFNPKRLRPFSIGWSHNGTDFAGSTSSKGLPADADSILSIFSRRPTFLMVGTIEPRKAHLQTLAAFELLWDHGVDVNLVIVGKQGWKVETWIDKLRDHSERHRRLFWLPGISDEYLEKVYAASTCLIAASEGEGFGLPLIEAAQHKLPIIARDIPVFREVAGDHAFYFSGTTPHDLSDGVQAWLALYNASQAPRSDNMHRLTWKQSTKNLLEVILGGNWYQQWMPDGVYRFWGSDRRLFSRTGKRLGRDIVSTGLSGQLIYGPYITMDAGQYRVRIRGALGEEGAAPANMDVAIDKGKRILAKSVLSQPDENGWLVSLPISLDTPCTDFEVRVWVEGHSEVTISMLEIQPFQASELESAESWLNAKCEKISP